MQTLEGQSYQDFSLRLHNEMVTQRVAANASIEVTRRCPLECVHCYNNLPMGDLEAKRGELTYEEHCRILDEMAEAGCLWLLYTGGEIFARKDFLDIYTYAKKKGFIVSLFTNGNLITPKIADYLAEWLPFSIEITLYGGARETYERLTGIPGSYDRCMRGIQLLRERKLPLALKTVAISINKHEIGEMKRFAEELGLSFKFDGMMNPRIDCSQSPLAVRLQPWEVVKMDLEDPERVAEWKKFAARFNGPANPPERSDEVYHCGGGINGFAIDPEGKMTICVLSHVDCYDLRQGSFREGWDHFLHQVRRKKITRVTKCTACEIKAMCGMCPANGELESGDPEAPVEFLCHVAHLRAAAMDIPVPAHGDCAYCEGGAMHPALLDSLRSLQQRQAENWLDHEQSDGLFPILKEMRNAPGGCSSCGFGSQLPPAGVFSASPELEAR
ncbi:MAG: radical SAM protein [Bryobacteraceae bacterium]|jgi:radical SAM protein with 4Fe4S-binding SPASM domain